MNSYEVEPAILEPLVPRGTELDEWNGTTYLSLVGFQFLRTRVLRPAVGDSAAATVAPADATPSGSGMASPVSAGLRTEAVYDFLAPSQGPDEIGRLGPYRVLKLLGAGGMGVVFKAEDPQLQRPVALKAMLPSLAARATANQRFLREARAAAAIKHDHVVTIFQVGEDRGVPFLAMEFLEGESLPKSYSVAAPVEANFCHDQTHGHK